ncbi:hypothetical protein FBU59_004945 [Linderina macrospora]|uniref:Uncharacterized protein n=1 Tax=Linderina macrospora TaxID=4868 RepID=A0ACC1J4D1_9FUNG|nr:hypothetical protein FBU59_004945 [Linderina macrospora]
MIRPRVFLQLLELAAVENSVAFPNLESLSVLLDAIGPEDAYIPIASKQVRYNFPKLRSLSLRSDKDSSPDMYWIFKDAPLERLHLATNTSFLEQLDLSHFPKLAHVRLTSRPQFRRVSFFDIQNRLTGPASNIRTLDIDVTLQVMVTSWVFGCAKLRSLKIAHDVSPPVLRSVLKQLPELVTLDIQHYLTHREGNVDLPDMRKAVLESDLSIINNSLQSLFVTDKYIFQLNDPYTANAVKLVELVAHLPSLLKLTIVGSRPRIRGQLIEDTFADSAIQECAHHFANVSVHLHDLLE